MVWLNLLASCHNRTRSKSHWLSLGGCGSTKHWACYYSVFIATRKWKMSLQCLLSNVNNCVCWVCCNSNTLYFQEVCHCHILSIKIYPFAAQSNQSSEASMGFFQIWKIKMTYLRFIILVVFVISYNSIIDIIESINPSNSQFF